MVGKVLRWDLTVGLPTRGQACFLSLIDLMSTLPKALPENLISVSVIYKSSSLSQMLSYMQNKSP